MISTTVYWLVDMRSALLRKWPRGLPFYCGMTTLETEYVLDHMRKYADGDLGRRLNECGRRVSVHVVDVVPAGQDEFAVRRRSTWVLRQHFPGCANHVRGPSSKRKLREKRLRNIARRQRLQ